MRARLPAVPEAYLVPRAAVPERLAACHLVGGRDPLAPDELADDAPHDGYPVLLEDWIERDGLFQPQDQADRQRRGGGTTGASCAWVRSRCGTACRT